MASLWKWGTVNLYTNSRDISREIKQAELFVIDATESVFQFLGSGSRKYNLKCLIIGDTDRLAIEADAIANTSRTLTTPWGSITSLKIHGTPKFSDHKYAGGTLDGTAYSAEVTPLYDLDMEVVTIA